jgi:hypothetical protein
VLLLSMSAVAAPASEVIFPPVKERLAETPAAFAQRIVRLYDSKGRWWREQTAASDEAYRARVFEAFYDPEFSRLIKDNRTLASRRWGGEDMEDDPVCQCQDDPGGIRVTSVRQRQGDFADVSARVECAETPGCGSYVIVLRRIGRLWKIHDVIDSAGSRRAWLTRHNACMRSSLSEAVIRRCMR